MCLPLAKQLPTIRLDQTVGKTNESDFVALKSATTRGLPIKTMENPKMRFEG